MSIQDTVKKILTTVANDINLHVDNTVKGMILSSTTTEDIFSKQGFVKALSTVSSILNIAQDWIKDAEDIVAVPASFISNSTDASSTDSSSSTNSSTAPDASSQPVTTVLDVSTGNVSTSAPVVDSATAGGSN